MLPESAGTNVTDTKSEQMSEIQTVHIRSWNIIPIAPSSALKIISGTKTQIVVSVEAVIALTILWLPSMADSAQLAPLSLIRYVFSRIIIEASTIIPIPRIRPLMLIVLIEMSATDIIRRVKRIQIGIESAMIKVVLMPRRNKNITAAAKIIPRVALV